MHRERGSSLGIVLIVLGILILILSFITPVSITTASLISLVLIFLGAVFLKKRK